MEPNHKPTVTYLHSPVIIHEINKYSNLYKVTFEQSHNGTKRRVSELLSEDLVLGTGGGKGLYVGQVISGWCINMLISSQPFFDGQQPNIITGLYSKIVMEHAEPGESNGDRNVSGSNTSELNV